MRKFLILIIVLSLALSVTACGKNGLGKKADTKSASDQTIVQTTNVSSLKVDKLIVGEIVADKESVSNKNTENENVKNSQVDNQTVTKQTVVDSNVTKQAVDNSNVINNCIVTKKTIVNSDITKQTVVDSKSTTNTTETSSTTTSTTTPVSVTEVKVVTITNLGIPALSNGINVPSKTKILVKAGDVISGDIAIVKSDGSKEPLYDNVSTSADIVVFKTGAEVWAEWGCYLVRNASESDISFLIRGKKDEGFSLIRKIFYPDP